MPLTPGRGHEALRRGRWSAPGAEYFLTLCTHDRRPGLTEPSVASAVLARAHQLTTEGHWHLRTATVMSDHLHLFVTLGEHHELSAAIRLFKGPAHPRASHRRPAVAARRLRSSSAPRRGSPAGFPLYFPQPLSRRPHSLCSDLAGSYQCLLICSLYVGAPGFTLSASQA